MKLMAGLAQLLPVRVICDVPGLPPDDFAHTKLWSDALALIVEPVSRRETRIASNRAAEEMVAACAPTLHSTTPAGSATTCSAC